MWCQVPRDRDAVAVQHLQHYGTLPAPAALHSAPSWCWQASRQLAAVTHSTAVWLYNASHGHQKAEVTADIVTLHRAYYRPHTNMYTQLFGFLASINIMALGAVVVQNSLSNKDSATRALGAAVAFLVILAPFISVQLTYLWLLKTTAVILTILTSPLTLTSVYVCSVWQQCINIKQFFLPAALGTRPLAKNSIEYYRKTVVIL